jgi:hypothetical protein
MKLIGEKNSKTGIIKIFEALQDYRSNKHLFYVRETVRSIKFGVFDNIKPSHFKMLLEAFLRELCPQMFE